MANESLACAEWAAESATIPISGWLEHTMIEKYELKIENKVVRIPDIRRLATLVDEINVDYIDTKVQRRSRRPKTSHYSH